MPFSSVKPLLIQGEALLESSKLGNIDEIIRICHMGLGYLAHESATFCGTVLFCASITQHFESELTQLIHLLNNRPDDDNTDGKLAFYGNVQACAFALVEDMALFMREKKLRSGAKPQHEMEEKIMLFFENCGNWLAGSGEMVVDMYYTQIPLAVKKHNSLV